PPRRQCSAAPGTAEQRRANELSVTKKAASSEAGGQFWRKVTMDEIGNSDDEYKPSSALDLDADDLDELTSDDADDLAEPDEPDEPDKPDEPTALSSDDIGGQARFDDIGPLERVPAAGAVAGPSIDIDALRYAEAQRHPLLEADEERRLAQRWREHGDRAARDKLVNSHLRLVEKIARDRHRCCPKYIRLDELIAEGRLGLVNAANGFDPSLGNRFSSYARAAITNAINGHINALSSIAKTGDGLRRKLYALQKELRRLERVDNNALTRDEVRLIAERLGWEEEDVVNLHARLFCRDMSLHTPICDKNGEPTGELLQDQLEDEGPGADALLASAEERDYLRQVSAEVLTDKRSLRIFVARHLTDPRI